jgi:hypothetical protein
MAAKPPKPAVLDKPNAWKETEKSLTLAEALVRHATAIEQAALLAQDESVYSVLSTPPAAQSGPQGWLSMDLLAPTSADHPQPMEAAPAVPMVVEDLPDMVEPTEPQMFIMDKPPHTDDWSCGTLPLSACEAETLCDGALASEGCQSPEFPPTPEFTPTTGFKPTIELNKPAGLSQRIEPASDDFPSIRIQLPAAHEQRAELDLIVIEEEPAEPAVETAVQAAPVKRHEYRRLFAKLRKG